MANLDSNCAARRRVPMRHSRHHRVAPLTPAARSPSPLSLSQTPLSNLSPTAPAAQPPSGPLASSPLTLSPTRLSSVAYAALLPLASLRLHFAASHCQPPAVALAASRPLAPSCFSSPPQPLAPLEPPRPRWPTANLRLVRFVNCFLNKNLLIFAETRFLWVWGKEKWIRVPYFLRAPYPLPSGPILTEAKSLMLSTSEGFTRIIFFMKRREVLLNLLTACNHDRSIAQLHSQTIKTGFAYDSFFATKFNSLYAKYKSLGTARRLFDETPQRSVHLWNVALRSYCREKQWGETLFLFRRMVSEQRPDSFTVPIALKACAGLRLLRCGTMIHGVIKKDDKSSLDMFVGSALIELYSKCGQMGEALKVFEEFAQPDIVLWTSIVTGYEQNGNPEDSLKFFSQMVIMAHADPDPVTLVSVVSACAKTLNLKLGCSVHGFVIRRDIGSNVSLANSLLNFYAKTGSVKFAANLFGTMNEKDVISWSSMIACYVQYKSGVEALSLFNEMIDRRLEPNSVSMVSALQACAVACNLEEGRKIHELATQKGLEFDVLVSTSLIDMYMKCLSPEEAVVLFNRLPNKDVVSWATLLSGYAQNAMATKSIGVFRDMLINEVQPDAVVVVKLLAACSELGILQQALCLHGYVISSGFNDNIFVGSSLIELYCKCGSLDNAIKLFNRMNNRDVVIWSSMIAGYGIHGQGTEALKVFGDMVTNSSVRPNRITFLSILSACSHGGLIKEGIEIFDMMVHNYKLKPDSEHCGIMVDLLGRIGELDKAIEIINQMPILAGPHVWGALLGACRIHQNVEIGEIAARNLFVLDPNHAGYYILLSNIYAVDGKWDDVAKLRSLIKEKGLKKMYGKSLVEVSGKVHSFVAGDRFHLNSQKIYMLLRNLELRMREEGYVPDMDFLLHDLEGVSQSGYMVSRPSLARFGSSLSQ